MKRLPAGFTLLEVLVVVAVTGLILVLLSQGLSLGLRGLDGFSRAVDAQGEMVPITQALRQMIERMDPGVYPDPPSIRGTNSALAFTTDLPNPATGGSLTADVRLEAEGGSLILWWTPHTRGIPFNGPPAPQQKVLLEGVERVRFGYLARGSQGTWLSSWSQQALPGVVRLVIVPADGKAAWPPIIVRPPREQAEE